MQLSKKEVAILTPIVFYSVLGHSIDRNNVFRLAYKEMVSKKDFPNILDALKNKGLIKIDTMQVAFAKHKLSTNGKNHAQEILKENKLVLKNLTKFPFIKSIILINSLGFGTAHQNSDIDLLVICEGGKLAITRDLVKSWLLLKRQKIKRGRLAIDIWLDTKHLDISDFRLPKEDIFFDFWLANFTPIYDKDDYFRKFVAKNSNFKLFPNYIAPKNDFFKIPKNKTRLKKSLEKFLNTGLGKKISKISEQKMLKRLKAYKLKVQQQGAIVVSRSRLRFNIPDKRKEIQKKFNSFMSLT